MHVGDLLEIEGLDLTLLWSGGSLLAQTVGGVTATDLADPSRFLQAGDIVLSGLVWWRADEEATARTERFVSALAANGATALLAGEETHGEVPVSVVEACRSHGVALLAVPAHTNFRAITEAVYRHRWSDLSRRPADRYALPGGVRHELDRLVDAGAPAEALLACAFAPFGGPAGHLLTSAGRTVARTLTASGPLPPAAGREALRGDLGATVRVPGEAGAYDAWFLHVPQGDGVPPRALHEVAELIGRFRQRCAEQEGPARGAGETLVAGLEGADAGALADALGACGPLADGPWRVVSAHAEGRDPAALREALRFLPPGTAWAAGPGAGSEALAVVQDTGRTPELLAAAWPHVHACRPDNPLHLGLSSPVPEPGGLPGAVAEARYARAAAARRVPEGCRATAAEELTSVESLLAGVPAEVRAVFSRAALGPLADSGKGSQPALLETLESFLAHNCSWTRTAEALHLHVNTVHYRIDRIRVLTGRDLTRLDHRLDLWAALLCR
jgi:hypothetical protein